MLSARPRPNVDWGANVDITAGRFERLRVGPLRSDPASAWAQGRSSVSHVHGSEGRKRLFLLGPSADTLLYISSNRPSARLGATRPSAPSTERSVLLDYRPVAGW
jgi:hypothetical protein